MRFSGSPPCTFLWLLPYFGLGEALRRAVVGQPARSTSDAAAAVRGSAAALGPTEAGDVLGSLISDVGKTLVSSAERAGMDEELARKRRARDSSTVDFCMVVTNDGPTQEFGVFLHSVNKHRGSMAPKFNVLTNSESLDGVRAALKKEGLYDAEFAVLHEDRIKEKLDELRLSNGFHGGMAAIAKAFMWEFWPEVERCVTLDSDTYLIAPLEELSAVFATISGKQVMAGTWRPHMEFGDMINTGVLFQDFGSMRRHGWSTALRASTSVIMTAGTKETTGDGRPVLQFADQELVHGALMSYCNESRTTEMPGCGMSYLDRRWNTEMVQYGFFGSCTGGYKVPKGILHFDSVNLVELPYWCFREFKQYQWCIQDFMFEALPTIYPDCPPDGFIAAEAP